MSERAPWKVNTAYSFTVLLFDAANAPKTGEASNFATKLAADDVNSAVTVTVTEIDSSNLPGFYKVVYTPNATGHWACWVKHSTLAPRGWLDEIQATDIGIPGAAEIADALLDRAAAVDGYTPRQVLRLLGAVVVAKCSGEPNNPVTFRSLNDAADRVAATIDPNGNRTTITLTP